MKSINYGDIRNLTNSDNPAIVLIGKEFSKVTSRIRGCLSEQQATEIFLDKDFQKILKAIRRGSSDILSMLPDWIEQQESYLLNHNWEEYLTSQNFLNYPVSSLIPLFRGLLSKKPEFLDNMNILYPEAVEGFFDYINMASSHFHEHRYLIQEQAEKGYTLTPEQVDGLINSMLTAGSHFHEHRYLIQEQAEKGYTLTPEQVNKIKYFLYLHDPSTIPSLDIATKLVGKLYSLGESDIEKLVSPSDTIGEIQLIGEKGGIDVQAQVFSLQSSYVNSIYSHLRIGVAKGRWDLKKAKLYRIEAQKIGMSEEEIEENLEQLRNDQRVAIDNMSTSEYEPYTSEFDIESTPRELVSDFQLENSYQFFLESMRGINPNIKGMITRGIGEMKQRILEKSELIPPITLVLDNSGSYRGGKDLFQVQLTYLLGHALNYHGIDFEILGYTTNEWKGGKSRKKWNYEGRQESPGRLNDLLHIVYKDQNESFDLNTKKGLAAVLGSGIMKENIDGEALEWAKMRIGQGGVLVHLNDGAPVDDATLSVNPADYLDKHLEGTISRIILGGTAIVGIGIDYDLHRTPYTSQMHFDNFRSGFDQSNIEQFIQAVEKGINNSYIKN